MSAYLMSCLHNKFLNLNFNPAPEFCQNHQLWDERTSWKSWLNNLRLILQPLISFNLITLWLKNLPIRQLSFGFPRLIAKMNEVNCLRFLPDIFDDFYCSSA